MSSPHEAIMRLIVATPEHFLGTVLGDLQTRGGLIKKVAPLGEVQGVLALVPMTNLGAYPADLDHLTQGQAAVTPPLPATDIAN